MKVNVGLTSIGEEHARGHPHMMFNEKKYDEHYIKLAELGRGSKNTNTLWTSHIEAPKMPVPTSKIERTKRGKLGRSPASSRLILHCETLAWEVSCTYIVHQNYFLPFLLFCQQAMHNTKGALSLLSGSFSRTASTVRHARSLGIHRRPFLG